MSEPGRDLYDYRAVLGRAGLGPGDAPHLVAAGDLARREIVRARQVLAALPMGRGTTAIALGSLGRHEVSTESDLDLAFLYDPAAASVAAAEAARREVIAALAQAGHDIPEKTFREAVPVDDIVAHIGGERDTNRNLTYRALLLTEGVWLHDAAEARMARERVFDAYRDDVTRGRFLTALLNDLHRYYRTVCLDYRWKVEVGGKDWGTRNIKLRHSRKLWHLANLTLACAALGVTATQEDYDAWVASHLASPPLVKLAVALEAMDETAPLGELVRAYDHFLGRMARPEVRAALRSMEYATRDSHPVYDDLRQNADRLDLAACDVVERLMKRHRDHLIRFGLL